MDSGLKSQVSGGARCSEEKTKVGSQGPHWPYFDHGGSGCPASHAVLVCRGYPHRAPQKGQLMQQSFITLSSGGWMSKIKEPPASWLTEGCLLPVS